MLAQNFASPAQLGLCDEEHAAHVTVLGMLERGELIHVDETKPLTIPIGFNMYISALTTRCGTVGCIGGWVAMLMGLNAEQASSYVFRTVGSQERLYYPHNSSAITTDQAARALRNYLTHGEAMWKEVLA